MQLPRTTTTTTIIILTIILQKFVQAIRTIATPTPTPTSRTIIAINPTLGNNLVRNKRHNPRTE